MSASCRGLLPRLFYCVQSFVSHPIRSLAQAYVYRDQCQPFGIYEGDTMVGYVMVIYDYDIPEYDIWHMMIDESRQNKGFGNAALNQVLEYIKTKPFGSSNRVTLTCSKGNGEHGPDFGPGWP
jgi:diamine N-acetyltransferase